MPSFAAEYLSRLPKIREQVREQAKATEEALAQLPAKLVGLPAVEINALISRFYEELRLYIEGAQGYESLLQSCLGPYRAFKTSIRNTAPVFELKDPEESGISPNESGYAYKPTIGLQDLKHIIDSYVIHASHRRMK